MSVSRMAEAVRVQSSCRHTMDYLQKLGVPENNSIQVRSWWSGYWLEINHSDISEWWLCLQVELGSTEEKTLTLQSLFGRKQAGLSLKMKCGHLAKEVKAAVWHSGSWLQDRGVPTTTEVYKHILDRDWSLQFTIPAPPVFIFCRGSSLFRDISLSFTPKLNSLWMDVSCSPLHSMSVQPMGAWLCSSYTLHQQLIKQNKRDWTQLWLLSSKVRLPVIILTNLFFPNQWNDKSKTQ